MNALKRLVLIFIVALFLLGVWITSTEKSAVKPFWLDELNELRITCRWNYWDTIIHGAHTQCSPHPFYYLLSKAVFNIRKVNQDEPMREILIQSRILSRISLMLLLLILIAVFRKYLRMNWKWLPIVFFIFFNYLGTEEGHIFWASTETRPYAFWLLLTSLNLLLLHSTMDSCLKNERIDGLLFTLYSFVSFLLIFTASPGIIQVFIPLILAYSLWRFDCIKPFIQYRCIIGYLFLFAGVLLFRYYEYIGGCGILPFYGNTWGTVFQFFTGYRTPLMFMLMILGWIHGLRNRSSMLSRMIFSQFMILILMVAIVHIRNYYFVPRVFIMGHFLSFYLAVAGCIELESYMKLNTGKLKHFLMTALWFFFVLVAIYHSPNLKEIIRHGIFLKPIISTEAVIDQRIEMIFPLCSEMQKK